MATLHIIYNVMHLERAQVHHAHVADTWQHESSRDETKLQGSGQAGETSYPSSPAKSVLLSEILRELHYAARQYFSCVSCCLCLYFFASANWAESIYPSFPRTCREHLHLLLTRRFRERAESTCTFFFMFACKASCSKACLRSRRLSMLPRGRLPRGTLPRDIIIGCMSVTSIDVIEPFYKQTSTYICIRMMYILKLTCCYE